jgi:hypothetical protein
MDWTKNISSAISMSFVIASIAAILATSSSTDCWTPVLPLQP